MPKVLIVGGTSDVGRALARRYAREGWSVALTARDPEAGAREAADLTVRSGRPAELHVLDILDERIEEAMRSALEPLPDTILCVVGMLGDQARAETDSGHARQVLRANFEGPALALSIAAERFRVRGSGTIAAISSVAGERGRASNSFYGAAKAGLTAYLSGLRMRLSKDGIRVVTVKPGYIRTRMTSGFRLPPLLTATPDEVAAAVFLAAERRGSDIVYVKPIWRIIMLAIRCLPERAFKRLSF